MPTTNPVPSQDPSDLIFNAGKLDEVVSGSNAIYTDRLGVSRRTMAGVDAAADLVLGGLGYAPPVAYAAGIALTLTTQTVEYAGEVYAPKTSMLPFTTSGTFETAKFRMIQGVAATDLAASGGAAMVGYMPAGTGAVATSVQSKLREAVSVKDFGAVGDGVTDDSAAIQAAIDYTYTKENNVGGKQLGGVVYFPKGRYLIKSSLVLPVGTTIQGEPSGLASAPINLPSSGSQIVVSATLTNGSPWNNSAAFTVPSGGPITIQDIAVNGTQAATISRCVYLGDGVTNTGITQGHFKNVRFVGFSNVFYGAKMFDCSFYDCGFESNTNCFNFIGGAFAQADTLKFVSCIFFEGSSSYFQISGGALLQGVVMSACIFQQNPAVPINNNVFNIYDATLADVSIVGCLVLGKSGDNFIKTLSGTSGIQRLILSGNNFTETDVFNTLYQPPVNLMYDIVVSNNTLYNSSFTSDYEVKNLVISGNVLRGTSVVSLSQCNSLIINSNDFSTASTVPPIALTDIFSNVSISNNLFSSLVASIPINGTSTRVKMVGNVYIPDVLMP